MKKELLVIPAIMSLALGACAVPSAPPASPTPTEPVSGSVPPSFAPAAQFAPDVTTPPSTPTSSQTTRPVFRPEPIKNAEQAVRQASLLISQSLVDRADNISAEKYGWYWEITFDGVDADGDELMPFPFKGFPPGDTRRDDPYPGLWRFVVVMLDAESGNPMSGDAGRAPRPGPYIAASQAVSVARQAGFGLPKEAPEGLPPPDASWADDPNVEAYLRGDMWIVLFGVSASPDNRWIAKVDAVTGEWKGTDRG